MKKIIIGVLAFFVLLVFAAPFLIPTKMISEKINGALEQSLHKKTKIDGVHVSIFPKLGIKVSGIEIGTEKKDDFYVKLQSMFLELAWKPLLKKEISISQLSLTKPTIEMYEVKSEEKTETPVQPTSDNKPSDVKLHIDALSIEDASFTMFDSKMKPTTHIGGMSEKLSFDYSSDGTSTIDGDTVINELSFLTAAGELGRNTKLEIRKKIKVDAKTLNIQELKIKLGKLPISLEGIISDYSTETPDVDLKFSGGPSDIDNIIGLIPSKMLPSDLKNIESKGNLLVQGKLKGKINTKKTEESIQNSDFLITMNLTNGFIKTPQLPSPMSNISFSFQVDPKTVQIKNFHTEFGKSIIEYSTILTNYMSKNPTYQFSTNSSVDLKDVTTLHPDMPVKDLKGMFIANLQASGSTKTPESTILNGSLQGNEISFQYPEFKYDINHINTSIKLDKNDINIQNITMNINDSDLSGHGKIQNVMAMMNDDKNSLLKFSITAASKNLNADALMPPPSKEESAPLPDAFYKLDGDFSSNISKLTFNKLAMTNVVGNIGIHKGLVTLKPISLNTFNGTISLNGNVDLKNKNKPIFDLDTELKNIAVEKALGYSDNISKLLKLENSLTANIGLKAKAKGEMTKDFNLNTSSLTSMGNFTLNNASIKNHPIQKAFSKYFNSEKFDKIDIKQWTQAFSIENGKLKVSDLNFAAQDFSFNINGWQSIEGKNDFSIDAKLPSSLTSKIIDKLPAPIAALVGNQKQMTLPFSISGETTSPSLGLNSEKLAGSAKEQIKEQLTNEVKSQVKETKENLTKNLKADAKNLIKSPSKADAKNLIKKDTVKKETTNIKNKLKKLF